MMRPPAPVPPPPACVGLKEIVAFGAGDAGFNIIWGLMLSYLAYFYTDICFFLPAWWGSCCWPRARSVS
ncbi:hypothetical protein RI056_06365 [Komagataeibacter nataicola]|uniref:hypothetical protein n=1 Tax=Komagataeibacter nataicola TaxID=265960 RepID=UPI0028ADE769|nr:hypothetical protein [Komagataeibacter nataicola]WNM09558.1 hypothetical protein RI056_06365 [Komagataeibacter nataicola]